MPGVLGGAACAAVCGAGALMTYGVRGRSATLFAPSIYRGPASRRAVALTFDDGPSESTPALLRLLAEHHIPATFFQCGANVERLPEIAREVSRCGHEIGNHSHSHPPFYFRTAGFIHDELARAQSAIARITEFSPKLFRAPFGVRWPGMGAAQHRLRLTGVMWTVIGRDWKLSAPDIFRRVARSLRNGAIVCLHDGRELQSRPNIEATIEAVRRLIPILKAEGYRLETVSQLICPTN
ncbi:MAG TPA: polysaccharide deacetylase family protein [Bryobacteraceae bacterium]|nr:polysaccharide deacetylase family protein [Bryobacteraceae bacterium]